MSALGEVLVEVNELNRRLQPHIERFTRIVQDDGEMNQDVRFMNYNHSLQNFLNGPVRFSFFGIVHYQLWGYQDENLKLAS